MPSNKEENKPLKRQQLLLQLILEGLKTSTASDTITLFVKDLQQHNLFSDYDHVQRTLVALSKEFGSDFYSISSTNRISSAADVDNRQPAKQPYQIKFFIDDRSKLTEYLDSLNEKLTEPYRFILKGEFLFLKGEEHKRYKMKPGSKRYDFLHFLALARGPVTTEKLAKALGLTKEEVRGKVEELRTAAKRKFGSKEAGEALIIYEVGHGYSVPNLSVK